MRRRAGTLLPIELSILETGIELRVRGMAEFYGFLIAKEARVPRFRAKGPPA